ncbi:unnamed protein product [Closterium sp. Naga37s-1]|nr:unnamed protein product [Closterium sp. Naga37s-1]
MRYLNYDPSLSQPPPVALHFPLPVAFTSLSRCSSFPSLPRLFTSPSRCAPLPSPVALHFPLPLRFTSPSRCASLPPSVALLILPCWFTCANASYTEGSPFPRTHHSTPASPPSPAVAGALAPSVSVGHQHHQRRSLAAPRLPLPSLRQPRLECPLPPLVHPSLPALLLSHCPLPPTTLHRTPLLLHALTPRRAASIGYKQQYPSHTPTSLLLLSLTPLCYTSPTPVPTRPPLPSSFRTLSHAHCPTPLVKKPDCPPSCPSLPPVHSPIPSRPIPHSPSAFSHAIILPFPNANPQLPPLTSLSPTSLRPIPNSPSETSPFYPCHPLFPPLGLSSSLPPSTHVILSSPLYPCHPLFPPLPMSSSLPPSTHVILSSPLYPSSSLPPSTHVILSSPLYPCHPLFPPLPMSSSLPPSTHVILSSPLYPCHPRCPLLPHPHSPTHPPFAPHQGLEATVRGLAFVGDSSAPLPPPTPSLPSPPSVCSQPRA